MNNEFVPYEQALALKELGFDEPCFTSYDDEKRLRNLFDYKNSDYYLSAPYIEDSRHWIFNSELTIENFIGNKDLYTQFIAAPLYQQAFDWFREKHKLVVNQERDGGFWHFDIKDTSQENYEGVLEVKDGYRYMDSYEDARLACLQKLIELAKEYPAE